MRRHYPIIPRLYLQWAGAPDEGRTLELVEADDSGAIAEGGLDPAATIVADDNEVQWLEIYPPEGIVRIPLSEVVQATKAAKDGVHGERYYDQLNEHSQRDAVRCAAAAEPTRR